MKLIFLIVISIFVVIFAVQNSNIVTVTLFNTKLEGSLALIIILCYLIGVLCGFIYIIPSIIKKNLTISDLRQKLNNQTKETTKKST